MLHTFYNLIMEQILGQIFQISIYITKCKSSIKNINYPAIQYSIYDIDKSCNSILKCLKGCVSFLSIAQKAHIKYVLSGFCSEIREIMNFLETHKLFLLFNTIELVSLKLCSVV